MPVLVDNDANLGALAEHWWGAGRGVDDFAYIKVATGIGSGHFIGGRIYRGASGVAGEIGHLTIDPRGRPVHLRQPRLPRDLGRAAGPGRARATRCAASIPRSVLAGGDRSPSAAIEDAALAGDPLALQVVREAAEYLGDRGRRPAQPDEPGRGHPRRRIARLRRALLVPLRETVLRRTFVSSRRGLGDPHQRARAAGRRDRRRDPRARGRPARSRRSSRPPAT